MFTNYAVTAACVAAKHEDMSRARRHLRPREPKTRRPEPSVRVPSLGVLAVLRFLPAKATTKQL